MTVKGCHPLRLSSRDGRIKIQGFMAGLVKSELYKSKFFYAVSPIRGIELTTKHLLGRPPIDQVEIGSSVKLIADQGFDAFVDSLVTSEEYLETFGTDTVPYLRAFKSEARASCSTFMGMAEVTPANAGSENAMGSMSLLVGYLNKGVKLRSPAFVRFHSIFLHQSCWRCSQCSIPAYVRWKILLRAH